jgi:hypothetical protein
VRYGVGFWGAVIETLPDIYIRRWNSRADRIYGVTAHELAHWAHWDLNESVFQNLVIDAYVAGNNSDEAVIESWANGVEWQFAIERYQNLFNISTYSYIGNGQWKRVSPFHDRPDDLIYTSVVVDLIDDCNQRVNNCDAWLNRSGNMQPVDRVSDYTIQQIESSINGANSWVTWRNNMVNHHSNSSQAFVNELFGNWY